MHGLAGSGKTTASQAILERIGAIRLRTDVERKRLHGFAAGERSHSPLEAGLYSPEATRRTYDHVARIAAGLAADGHPVVVDGTFLKRWQRDLFRNLAADLHVPFAIATVDAPVPVLRERLASRRGDASEADPEVLDRQLATAEPLGRDEQACEVRPVDLL
jgi:predicted kinase